MNKLFSCIGIAVLFQFIYSNIAFTQCLSCNEGPLEVNVSNGPVTFEIPLPNIDQSCASNVALLWIFDFDQDDWIERNIPISSLPNPYTYTFSGPRHLDFAWFVRNDQGESLGDCRTEVIATDGCIDQQDPTVDCIASQTVALMNGSAKGSAALPTYSDDCEVVDRKLRVRNDVTGDWVTPELDYSQISDPYNYEFFAEGWYSLVWYAYDAEGNYGECITTVVVEGEQCMDMQEPTVLCNEGPITITTASFPITETIELPTYSDDCEIISAVLSIWDYTAGAWIEEGIDMKTLPNPYQYTFNSAGAFDFAWFVADGAGNLSECKTNIEIVEDVQCNDSEVPEVFCDEGPIVLNLNGETSVSSDFSHATITDDCGVDFSRNDLFIYDHQVVDFVF